MLQPVCFLATWTRIFDQLALAARLPRRPNALYALPAALGPLAALRCMAPICFAKAHCAVDPIAHLPRAHFPPEPASALYIEDDCVLGAMSGKSDHFAIVGAAWVWATARKVVKYLFCRDKGWVREEDLGV